MGPFHGLQFFKNYSRIDNFLRMQSSRNKLLKHGLPMSHRSWQEPASAWILLALQFYSGDIHLLRCGVLHRLLGLSCLTMIWNTCCRAICSGTWALLVLCPWYLQDGILTHFCSPPSHRCCTIFFNLLEYVTVLLVGSELATGRLILEPSGTGSVQHEDGFFCFLIKASPKKIPREIFST